MLPENFLWSTLLDLFIRDYSRLKILRRIVDGRNGAGLSGSFKLPILPQSHVVLRAVWVTRFLRPVHAE